ncbi:MAG: DUF2029 domain-containing protein [Cyanobacteria bacterium HKST-UBA01]|nr:DUF2029 domain-containing protein [Cyanobacteria bacterium HKST-UBA01]
MASSSKDSSKSAKADKRGKLSWLTAAIFIIFALFSTLMMVHKLSEPLLNPRWFINTKTGKADITDFFQYYQASALGQSKQSKKVYDPDVQKAWADELIAPIKSDKVFYNQQPPFSYTLLLPLSWLPPPSAYLAWCLAQMGFGLCGLYYLSRLGPLKSRDRLLFIAGVALSFPAYSCIWHGNTSFWLLGAMSLFIAFIYERKELLSGVFLALSTFKPQYLFPLTVPVAAMKRWKIAAALVIFELLLMLSAAPLIGFENVIGYPYVVTHAESSDNFIGVNAHKMISLRGPIAMFLSTGASLKITAAVMFLSLGPLFLLWRKCTGVLSTVATVDSMRFLWAVTICTMLLTSPHSHLFDFLLVAMAAALTLKTLSPIGRCPGAVNSDAVNKIWTIMLVVFPPLSWVANFAIGQEHAAVFFFFPYLFTLLILALLALKNSLSRSETGGIR